MFCFVLFFKIQTKGCRFLEFAEGVAKFGIKLMNAAQQGTYKVNFCHHKLPWVASCRHAPKLNLVSVFPSQNLGNPVREQLRDLMPVFKIHPGRKYSFSRWNKIFRREHKTSILPNFYKWSKTKTKIQINDLEIVGLVDKSVEVTIISVKSWSLDWPL